MNVGYQPVTKLHLRLLWQMESYLSSLTMKNALKWRALCRILYFWTWHNHTHATDGNAAQVSNLKCYLNQCNLIIGSATISRMCPPNEKRRYIVTSSLIGEFYCNELSQKEKKNNRRPNKYYPVSLTIEVWIDAKCEAAHGKAKCINYLVVILHIH